MKKYKKYKNTFYYYIINNELWVEDLVFPLLFKKIGCFNNKNELIELLEKYYKEYGKNGGNNV